MSKKCRLSEDENEREKIKYLLLMILPSAHLLVTLSAEIANLNWSVLLATEKMPCEKELLKPDVMTLDVEMPRLDGLATLRRLMETGFLPVIMVSSHTQKGSEITLEALSAGAVDFVAKPSLVKGQSVEELRVLLPQKIKAAAGARLYPRAEAFKIVEKDVQEVLTKNLVKSSPRPAAERGLLYVVAIGASTGGPRALEDVIRDFPADLPAAVLITQHMPPGFTDSLAKRLDRVSALKVREARGKEKILPGEAYVAPGGYHLLVEAGQTVPSSSPPHNMSPIGRRNDGIGCTLFGSGAIGVIHRMGRDGADGMACIKENGGRRSFRSSPPRLSPACQAVIKNGSVDEIVPLEQIAGSISRFSSSGI